MGLDTSDGIGGFTPFAEMWAGRWAMLGFASSIVADAVTGKGTLAQLGLEAPSTPLLAVIVGGLGVATLAGTANTISRLQEKKMTKSELDRYRSFLNLDNSEDYKAEAMAMKSKEAKAGGPADALQNGSVVAATLAEEDALKASQSAASAAAVKAKQIERAESMYATSSALLPNLFSESIQ